MKFLSCASYYGSGSSAITDLLSEYKNLYSFTDEEFRFLQDPKGVSDLEFNLVENFNRHNSGRAIKQYLELVDFYHGNIFGHKYESFFDNKWKSISEDYINQLVDFKYHGWWLYDMLDRGKWFYFRKRIINKVLKETVWKKAPERTLNNMKNEITYCAHPTEEKFLAVTRSYINRLFTAGVGSTKVDQIVVDQLVPSTNISRFIRYFDDIHIFIVDRDPRDIYVLEKFVWKDGVIPSDVETFCKWFLYTRSGREKELHDNKECAMYVQFEDLIYNYQETVSAIENWLGLKKEDHIRPRTLFNPERSLKNVHTWDKYDVSPNDIEYIEKKLGDYIYDDTKTRSLLGQ